MITRHLPCPFPDWPYAQATAAQWTEVTVTWDREQIAFECNAPRLLPPDAACIAEQAIEAIERSIRMHAFVRRAP